MTRDISLRIAVRDAEQAVARLRSFGTAGEQALTNVSRQATRASGAMGNLQRNIGGVGLQAQDIAVQLQSGTSPFIILGQQGSQIASLFGPGGAIFGALLAFGSIAAGTLFAFARETDDAAEATSSFAAALDDIKEQTGGAFDNLGVLGDLFGTIGDGFDRILGQQVAREFESINQVIAASRAEALELFSDLERFSRNAIEQSERGDNPPPAGIAGRLDEFREVVALLDEVRDTDNLIEFSNQLDTLLERITRLPENAIGETLQSRLNEIIISTEQELQRLESERQSLFERTGQSAAFDRGFTPDDVKEQQLELLKAEAAERRKIAREAEQQAEREAAAAARRDAITEGRLEKIRLEAEAQSRLLEATRDGEEAIEAANVQIRIQNELNAAGLSLDSERGREIAKLVEQIAAEKEAIEDLNEERERETRIQSQLASVYQEYGRTRRAAESAALNPEIGLPDSVTRRDEELDRALQALTDTFSTDMQSSVETFLFEFRTGTEGALESFAESAANNLARIPDRAIGRIIGSATDGLTDSVAEAFAGARTEDGGFDPNALGRSLQNPAVIAGIATIGAGIGSQLVGGTAGNALQGAALGGSLGAIFGPVGAGVGLGVGALGGALLGFGGGGNNRANAKVDPVSGDIRQDNSPGSDDPNRQAVTRIAQATAQLTSRLINLGADFGGEEIALRVSRTRDTAEAERGAVKQISRRIILDANSSLATVLRDNASQTLQELQADIDFAQTFDLLTGAATEVDQAFTGLLGEFRQLEAQARSLGLEEQRLGEARQEAIEDFVRDVEDSTFRQARIVEDYFTSRIEPLAEAANDIGSVGFSLGNRRGVLDADLDSAIAGLLSGEDNAGTVADLARQRIALEREFTGGAGGFGQFRDSLQGRIEELVGTFEAEQRTLEETLGVGLDDLRRSNEEIAAEQRDLLREQIDQLETLTRRVEALAA